MSSVFTRIIEGELPCYKIYEDEYSFAFLSIEPHQLGHTLIVPKVEVDYWIDLPEPYYTAIFLAAKKVATAIQSATECRRVGTVIAGWDIPHFHYHLIPANNFIDMSPENAHTESKENMLEIQQRIISFL